MLPEAAIYVPDDESVETIGRSYTCSGKEERSFVPLKKKGEDHLNPTSTDREGGEDSHSDRSTCDYPWNFISNTLMAGRTDCMKSICA